MEFKGCTAVVTGGASGLGEAVVRSVIAAGGRAAIFDLDAVKGGALADELGDAVIFLEADITGEESVQSGLDAVAGPFGEINVVVNCAGISPAAKVLGRKGPHDLSLFSKVLQVNLVGSFNVLRLAAARMSLNEPRADGERGVIINTASAAAFEGQIGQAAYSASKGGLVGFTLPIARELAAHGIRVVTIAPGIMETPMLMGMPDNVREALGKMVPFPQRLGYPAEFALLVRQVVENPLLNGATIRLDGAIRMQPK